jgi:hypothetical protein
MGVFLPALICFTAALSIFLTGCVAQRRRSSPQNRPYAIVDTVPYASVAAYFFVLGLWLLAYGVPKWALPLAFIAAVPVCGFAMLRAARQRDFTHPDNEIKESPMASAAIKTLLFPVLCVLGLVVAGTYGALHNQISYTVAPNYFHGFKFVQFDISPPYHNRWGAALVGWYASWWMGLFVGPPVLLIGLALPGWRLYLSRSLIAKGVVVATTLGVGLAALAYSYWAEPNVSAFDHAGFMHNASYMGGFAGILTGSGYMLYQCIKWRLVPTVKSNMVTTP